MEKKYPLTKQQEGLWVEYKLHPDNTSYNTCVKLRLTGELDKTRFEQALRDVVSFFPSLRVYFVEENGLPFQKTKQDSSFDLEYEDYSIPGQTLESQGQKAKAEEFLARKLRTPVDLKTFPIVRAGLVKTAPDTHYFIGLVPHMISDGVSAVLFLEATSIAYNKGHAGLIEAYGENVKNWDDYFKEQTQDQKIWSNAAAYWRERLSTAQHVVDFSYGHKESDSSAKNGKRVYFDLDHDLSQRLNAFSRAHRTTLFSTLVAAFGTLINRYYAQDDILIGYPVNIRPPGYKNFFGFFVNIIPIRFNLSGNPSFEELVSRVSEARKADKKHQTFPALDIVREIRKSQPGFDGRVFNLSMAQTVSRLVNLRLDGIHSEPLEAEYNDVNDDLSLSYELLEDGRIGLWLEYRESLFDPAFIKQMIAHMQSLLSQIAQNPSARTSDYPLLEKPQEKLFLEKWAHPDAPDPSPSQYSTIHEIIEARAEKMAGEIALVYADETTTYQQMNEQANRLAHYIQSKGIKPGEKIAICLRRGPDLIISLLSILKAGCAYVPIAPCYPADRAAFILKDAQCKMIITQDMLQQKFTCETLCVDLLQKEFSAHSPKNLRAPCTQNHDAYIIYTSGSTGNPKGVRLSHGNVIPRLQWLQSEMTLDETDIVLQNTDFSFDVSVAEIFWPLTTGARLILTEPQHYKDPAYIIGLIEKHKVTTTCFVPSLLNSLLAVLKGKLTTLKHVLAAGEALSPTLVKIYHEKCTGNLYNVYGPTEGTIYASYTLCRRDEDLPIIPIGRPIGATTLYILDSQQRPQPVGVAGELHIGGAGVAQGYVNRADLTAEKFIPDPFSSKENAKLYRTGDLARFKPDGNIEYLGRADAQVKIRGFRIELAEIESVISSFDGIDDVAVIDYDKRLIAYYVSHSETDEMALKNHIASKLPEYMAPAFYLRIDEVPRLPSGKINRRALPDPSKLFKKSKDYSAPTSYIEKELAQIWAGILKIDAAKISIHDSFFDIGGDSLMAIQFVCAAEEKGIIFDTNALFTNKTIAELAAAATANNARAKVDQGVISGTYPLMPRQAKFFADNFAQPHHWNRFFYFAVDHDMDMATLKSAADKVLMHHDNIRISFKKDDSGNWQQHCAPSLPSAEYVLSHDLTNLPQNQQEEKIIAICNDNHAALNLEKPPLLRIVHFKTSGNSGKLAIIIHHLLVDIVSSRIIFEDLLKTYESQRLGLDLPLAPKTAPVKEWATYLSHLAKTGDFTADLSYWASPKMKPTPAIKTDYPGVTKGYEHSCAAEKIILDRASTSALLTDIPSHHEMSIQDVLLASLLQTTKAWTGENQMLVNICGHGRDPVSGYNFGRTAGWLNTVFPVHLSHDGLDNAPTSRIMQAVRTQLKRVPKTNANYNLLRYIAKNLQITKYETPQLFFNYVSQIDALMPEGASIQPIVEPQGIQSSHGDNHLCYLLYIEAGIIDKRLNIHITYTQDIFKPQTISNFAALYKDKIMNNINSLTVSGEKMLVNG